MSTGGAYPGEAYPGGEPIPDAQAGAVTTGDSLGGTFPGAYPGIASTPVGTATGTPIGGSSLGGVYFGQACEGGTAGAAVNDGLTVVPDGRLNVAVGITAAGFVTATATQAVVAQPTSSGTASGTASLAVAATTTAAGSVATGLSQGAPQSVTAGTSASGRTSGSATTTGTAGTSAAGTVGKASGASTATSASVSASGQVGKSTQATNQTTVGTLAAGDVSATSGAAHEVTAGTTAGGTLSLQAELALTANTSADGQVTADSLLLVKLAETCGPASTPSTQEGRLVAHLLGADTATVSIPGFPASEPLRDRGYAVNCIRNNTEQAENRSFERWLRFKFPAGNTTVHDLSVTVHNATFRPGWSLTGGVATDYATPTSAASSVATVALSDGQTIALPNITLSPARATNSGWLVLQATVDSASSQGAMQAYEYDNYLGRHYVTGVRLDFSWIETVEGQERPGSFSVAVNAGLGIAVPLVTFLQVQSLVKVTRRVTTPGQRDASLTGRPVASPVQRQHVLYVPA